MLPVGVRVPLDRGVMSGRAILERRTIITMTSRRLSNRSTQSRRAATAPCRAIGHVSAPAQLPVDSAGARASGHRRADHGPHEVRPFTDAEVALLETFADQAAIAIENARLFQELEQRNGELQESNRRVSEALEQKTALAEVMRSIASSPTSLRPVLDAVTRSAARLCPVDSIAIWQIDGDEIERVASDQTDGSRGVVGTRIPLTRGSVTGRAILDRQSLQVADVQAEIGTQFPDAASIQTAQSRRGRTILAIPLRHDEAATGGLVAVRIHVRPFTDDEVRLLEAFADQAAVAIANTRLFQQLQQRNAELQESNRQVTEALDQQTATAEVMAPSRPRPRAWRRSWPP